MRRSNETGREDSAWAGGVHAAVPTGGLPFDALIAAKPIAPPVLWRDARLVLPAFVVALIYLGSMFAPEMRAAVRIWLHTTAYNHCVFILPLALWLAWDRRGGARGLRLQPILWPSLITLPLGLAWFLAERLGYMQGRQLAALAMLEALLVALLGWRLARVFAAPLGYLVFLVPFGAFLAPWLQAFTVRFVDAGLSLLGIAHTSGEFSIEIAQGAFHVADAASGLRFVVASLAFGALYACLLYRGAWRRAAFMLAALAVPVLANALRALGIVALGAWSGAGPAAEERYSLLGWGVFALLIGLTILAGLPFRQDILVPRSPRWRGVPTAPLEATTPWAAAVAVTVLAATGPVSVALLDRSGTPQPLVLPHFAPTAECQLLDSPETARQRFRCGPALLLGSVRALPPGSGPAALLAAVRDTIGERSDDSAAEGHLEVSGVQPESWRLVELRAPDRLVAVTAYADGQPAPMGVAGRLRLALDSMTGHGGPVVVVAASLQLPKDAWPEETEGGRGVLRRFLQGQTALLDQAALATQPGGKP
jgi:exosortase